MIGALDGDGTRETVTWYAATCTWSLDGLTLACVKDFDGDGDPEYSRTEYRDDAGQLIALDLVDYVYASTEGEWYHTFTYSEEGLLAEEVLEFYRHASLLYQLTTTYAPDGQPLSLLYDAYGDGTIDRTETWSYDSLGRELTYLVDSAAGDDSLVQTTWHPGEQPAEEVTTKTDATGALIHQRTERWTEEGTLAYQALQRPRATWETWYDQDAQQTQVHLVLPDRQLDITFPVLDPDLGPGHFDLPWFRSLRVGREASGYAYPEHELDELDDTPILWESVTSATRYSTGARRSASWRGIDYDGPTLWYPNGLLEHESFVFHYDWGRQSTWADLAPDGRSYHSERVYSYSVDSDVGPYTEREVSTYDLDWTCP